MGYFSLVHNRVNPVYDRGTQAILEQVKPSSGRTDEEDLMAYFM